MKILFVCGSLENGKNGVGDYTRRLAAELIRQGQEVRLLALADISCEGRTASLSEMVESQPAEGVAIDCLRLHATMPWNQRVTLAKEWMTNFPIDWISLQFVPYAYHSKGLCFGLGHLLKRALGGACEPKYHVMFHELWLGLDEKPSIKNRLWGFFQKLATMSLLRTLRPALVTTQADPYLQTLEREGIKATELPLFGNISVAPGQAWDDIFVPALSSLGISNAKRESFYLAGVFGAVYPGWDLEEVVRVVQPLAAGNGNRLLLVLFGQGSLEAARDSKLIRTDDQIVFLSLGPRSEEDISRIFNTLDLGLSTSPLYLIQKSGACAAMREHELPVLAARDAVNQRFAKTRKVRGVYSRREFSKLACAPERVKDAPRAKDVAALLLEKMTRAPR